MSRIMGPSSTMIMGRPAAVGSSLSRGGNRRSSGEQTTPARVNSRDSSETVQRCRPSFDWTRALESSYFQTGGPPVNLNAL
jgi:hypothetical protein